jgi:signal transduction histidine kinase
VEENRRSKSFFSVSSALKDLIGKELVTNQYVAILELIKNSYDANAKDARIIFRHSDPDNGKVDKLLILDDGKGMSDNDVREKWLFVGYSDKKNEKSGPGGRIAAGMKGIGRFSCDRLGEVLDMYTKTPEEEQWNHLHVNWVVFEGHQDVKFEDIPVVINKETLPSFIKALYPKDEGGTALVISKVRDSWAYDELFSLRKYLQRMVNPYEKITDFQIFLSANSYLEKDKKAEIDKENHFSDDDESFERWKPWGPVNGAIENIVIEEVRERSSWIRGTIRNGRIEISLHEGKETLIYTTEISPFVAIGKPEGAEKIEAEIFFLNRNAKNIFTRIMGVRPVDFGSIHVYRNAFRVFPYGETGDDWLELDRAKGQGWKRSLSTRDIMGRVSITDRSNVFKEVSSRQGFNEGEPFAELKRFMMEYIINRLQRYVVEAINWDSEKNPVSEEERRIESLKLVNYITGKDKGEGLISIGVGPNILEIVKEKEVQKIPELVNTLEALAIRAPNTESREYVEAQLKAVKTGVMKLSRNLKERESEIMFLEKSTSMHGTMAPILHHELVIAGADVIPALDKIIRQLSANQEMKEITDSLFGIRISVQKMVKVAELSLSAKFDLAVDEFGGDIVQYIVQYISKAKKDLLESNGVAIRFNNDGMRHKTDLRYLEVSMILDNLISNSLKAGAKKILVDFGLFGNNFYLRFSDNGNGVPIEVANQLFLPGISTRGGTGLGLYTIRKLTEILGGTISFLGNSVEGMEKGACFEVKL